MKRWLVVLLIAIALILLLSPALVGRLAERNLDDNLSWARDENADVEIEAESYDRGWFTSEGRHRITLREGTIAEVVAGASTDVTGEPPILIIDTRIDHGLVPITSLGRERGTLQPGIASAISTLQLDPGDGQLLELPGRIYSFVDLTGHTTLRYVTESGERTGSGAAIRWHGADITVTTSPNQRRLTVDGRIEPTVFDSFGVETDLGTIVVTADQDRSEFGLGIGTFSLDIDSFRLSSSGVPDSGFGAFSLSVDNALDDGRIDGETRLTIDDIVAPDIGNMDLNLAVTVGNMDAVAFAGILEAAQVAQERTDYAAMDDFAFVIQDDLEALFRAGFELDVQHFDFSMPEGDWRTSLKVEVPADPDDEGPFSWPSVLLRMNAVADISVSASLFEFMMQVDPQVGALIATGLVVRNGDRYEMHAEIDGGALTVNGAPIPIPAMLSQ